MAADSAPSGPLSEAERQEILRRHAAGESRNQIAAAVGRAAGTVSNVVASVGGSFARGEQVKAATEARQMDLAARRTALALALQEDAEKLRAQLWAPCVIGQFGGKDNEWNEVHRDQPPFADQRQIMAATSIAIDKSFKLSPPETDTEGLAAVDAWLKGMMGGD